MTDWFKRDLLSLHCIDCMRCCPRCLEGGDIGDAVIDCRPHDLVMVLPGLLSLRGIDDEPDLTPS